MRNLFEWETLHCGIQVQQYQSDNGVFTKSQLSDALLEVGQSQQVSGMGVHHPNGPAEQAICTIQDMICMMMLHFSAQWPDEYSVGLLPFAMDYAVWLYNHTLQKESGLAPFNYFV